MKANLTWERKLKKLNDPALNAALDRHRPRSKYNAKPTTVDGVRFDSAKEARRYQELKLLEKAGKIFRLQLQPRYPLLAFCLPSRAIVGDIPEAIGDYLADFRYCLTKDCICAWGCQIEDVKGYRTPLYRWKRKHAELQYRIVIHEI